MRPLLIVIVLTCAILAPASSAIHDLSGWNPVHDGNKKLDTQWEFYWKQFLSSSELASGRFTPTMTSVNRRIWISDANGELPSHGYGTYRLQLRLPTTASTLSLYTGVLSTASRIYWDGALLAQYGTPATRPELASPGWHAEALSLPAGDSNVHEILVHVSNYDDLAAGFREIPIIGTSQQVQIHASNLNSMSMMFAGFCLCMAVFQLLRLIVVKTDTSSMWFALVCLAVSIRILVSDSMCITSLLPQFDWANILRANYLTYTALVMGFALYITSLFPARYNRLVRIWSLSGSTFYTIVVCVFPPSVFTPYLLHFQIFSLSAAFLILAVFVYALVKKMQSARLFAFGFVVMFITVLFDIVAIMLKVNVASFSLYGIIFFIIIQALVLVQKSWALQQTSRVLAEKLSQTNNAQARFLPREFMQRMNQELVTDLRLGDHVSETMTVLVADFGQALDNAIATHKSDRLETLQSIHEKLGPIIREQHGFVELYDARSLRALFPTGTIDAINCAFAICKHAEKGIILPNSKQAFRIGIHSGSVLMGIVGEKDRMNACVLSSHVDVAMRMAELGESFNVRLLVSKDAIANIASLQQFHFRRVGGVMGELGIIPVYDFFDADPMATWRAKRSTRMQLARALRFFAMGRNVEAVQLLGQIMVVNPDDLVANYYYNQAAKTRQD